MKLQINDIIHALEDFAPVRYQESYDNAGLIVGSPDKEIESVLLSIDVTEEVVEEAIKTGAGLIVSHHPIIFKGLKKITGSNYIEKTVIMAIKNDIGLYAAHTNADAVAGGVNHVLAEKIGLKNMAVLSPRKGLLKKLYVFVPNDYAMKVRNAAFEAGGGSIGDYDNCSFNVEGRGSFRAGKNSNPFVGEVGKTHFEAETRVEIVYPVHLETKILNAVVDAHPYEEVAYDIISLDNSWDKLGMGMIGRFPEPLSPENLLKKLTEVLGQPHLRYTKLPKPTIQTMALCSGTGSFLMKNAIAANVDAFLTADVKYHEFFDAENKIMIIDAGHYETEQFTKELFSYVIHKKFPKFAVQFSNINTNPVNYY
ncbi:MAG: Nif3-like dinuclear metal center hexameric protein [Bacteroidales bacterium]